MGVEHVCQRHGRPAVASRVSDEAGRNPGGRVPVRARPGRGADVAAASAESQSLRRLLLRLLRRPPLGRSAPGGSRPASGDGRRDPVLQRRDPRAPAARGADRARVGQPRPRHRPPAVRSACRTTSSGTSSRQVDADPEAIAAQIEEEAEQRRAHGRLAVPLARTRRRHCSPPTRSRASSARPTSAPSTCCSRSPRRPRRRPGRLLQRFGVSHTKLRGAVIRGVEAGGAARETSQHADARRVRPRPDAAGARGQARPGDRPRRRDRADDRDPLPPDEEQPGADRRGRRRQDGDRRGDRPADRQRRGPRDARRQARRRARPGRHGRRVEVPRRVRGAAEEGDRRDHATEGDVILFIDELHTVVGAGAAEGAMDAGQHAQAGARPRRAARDRRDDARRVPQERREGPGARAPLPAGARPRADGRRDDRDPARAARTATRRTTASGSPTRRSSPRPSSPTATSATGSCPTRRST